VLEVIQHEQELFVAQVSHEVLEKGELPALLQAKGIPDGGHQQVRFADGSEPDKTDILGKLLSHLASQGQGQARLAYPRRPGERQQSHLGMQQPGTRCLQLVVTSDQRRERHRQLASVLK
jgi:hypothetical protein